VCFVALVPRVKPFGSRLSLDVPDPSMVLRAHSILAVGFGSMVVGWVPSPWVGQWNVGPVWVGVPWSICQSGRVVGSSLLHWGGLVPRFMGGGCFPPLGQNWGSSWDVGFWWGACWWGCGPHGDFQAKGLQTPTLFMVSRPSVGERSGPTNTLAVALCHFSWAGAEGDWSVWGKGGLACVAFSGPPHLVITSPTYRSRFPWNLWG